MYVICSDDSRQSHGNWDKQRKRYWKTISGFILIAASIPDSSDVYYKSSIFLRVSSSPPPPSLRMHLVMRSDGFLGKAPQAKFHNFCWSKKPLTFFKYGLQNFSPCWHIHDSKDPNKNTFELIEFPVDPNALSESVTDYLAKCDTWARGVLLLEIKLLDKREVCAV